jgi:hypothetical protein
LNSSAPPNYDADKHETAGIPLFRVLLAMIAKPRVKSLA